MKKKYLFTIFITIICLLLLTNCFNLASWVDSRYVETRVGLLGTNIIGIAGEVAEEPYIEIKYSVADDENPGHNKITSIWVSPPYIFQNDLVNITYEVWESFDSSETLGYENHLQRGFEEGDAEYLRIINHSQDKPVEFFIADVLRPCRNGYLLHPEIMYNKVPVYYLLFPEKNPSWNYDSSEQIMPDVWSADEVAALYKAEYSRSNEVQLLLKSSRLIDWIEENNPISYNAFLGGIFYGTINPDETLQGNEKIWLIATQFIFEPIFTSTSILKEIP